MAPLLQRLGVLVMALPTILVVDDEELSRWSLTERLRSARYHVIEAATGPEALEKLPEGVDLVLLDDRLPDTDGAAVLRKVKELNGHILAIRLTAAANVENTVQTKNLGAYDFVNKQCNLDDLIVTIERALETIRLRREVRHLRMHEARRFTLGRLVGVSEAMSSLRNLVAKAAATPASTVLLTGEGGTGKDLVARVLHYSSERAFRSFMNVTCSAFHEQRLERELFGHEHGAFGRARSQKDGLFETADGGTVFLDRIGEMPPTVQARLFRFLEKKKTFRRVGGVTDIQVDVRVVAATNRTLQEEIASGHFRRDLFHHLNVLPIVLPRLRDHIEDVPVLVDYFVDEFNREFGRDIRGPTPAALKHLQSYAWPGNVRELRNVIERAMLLAEGDRLQHHDFVALTAATNSMDGFELPPKGIHLEKLERSFVAQALKRTGGNQTKAAALLGLNRDQIRYRVEKFDLAIRRDVQAQSVTYSVR